MSKLLKSLAAASAFACLAASSAALAQSSPPLEGPAPSPSAFGMPQIFDATKTRLVGVALPIEAPPAWNRALLTFDNGVAVLFMSGDGFIGASVAEGFVTPEFLGVYHSTRNCSDPAYMRVETFPNYGRFRPDSVQKAGYSPGGSVAYPSRPFTRANLVARRSNGRCEPLLVPQQNVLVGVLARARVPAYKLPFFTK